jgi:hypothetical protein
MLFVLIPHNARSYEDFRIFTSFASAEQQIFLAAHGYKRLGEDPDWCSLIGYEGTDEVHPVFLYTLVGGTHLHREPYPSPSS